MNTTLTLLQILSTYNQSEIKEYLNQVNQQRELLQAEEQLWHVALTLSQTTGLSDELIKRIKTNLENGMVLISVDPIDGTEWWKYKNNLI